MKVRTQILLTLLVIAIAFVGGVGAIRYFERARFEELAERRAADWRRSMDDFLGRQRASLITLAHYYSSLDGIVSAVADQDRQWFAGRLTRDTLNGYDANAVWVISADFQPVYSVRNVEAQALETLPVPEDKLAGVFKSDRSASFFVLLAGGEERRFLEVRGFSIHPAWDTARSETAPQGYLFAGRIWDRERLAEIERLTGNTVRIVSPDEVPRASGNGGPSMLTYVESLPGSDGAPAGFLVATESLPLLDSIERQTRVLFFALTGLMLLLFLFLTLALMRAVNKPLDRITASLATKDLGLIENLQTSQSEFGELARLIHRFYEQRETLLREMGERVKTEAALRESEEHLRHSQKMEAIGRLAGGIAHDFNNLLTAIIGYADVLATELGWNSDACEHARLIVNAGQRAAALTHQLLAFSRKQLLKPRVLDLNQLIAGMQKLLGRIIGEHIEISTSLERVGICVRADPGQIEQVILNLGVNARDAMPRGGKLTIGVAVVTLRDDPRTAELDLPEGDYAELSVTDSGEGMDEATASRIFEPFFTTKGPGKGTGLGLATVYGIVRQSGGAVSVASQPGHGSTFRVYLPLESGPPDPIEEHTVGLELPRRGATILVTEDEEVVRELIKEVLSGQGYDVHCAGSGIEAIQIADDLGGKIDLLLTDVVMPQMSGQTLAARLRGRWPDLPVLYVSGYSDSDMDDQGFSQGDCELLNKPFTPGALVEKVREMLAVTT